MEAINLKGKSFIAGLALAVALSWLFLESYVQFMLTAAIIVPLAMIIAAVIWGKTKSRVASESLNVLIGIALGTFIMWLFLLAV